MNVVLLGNLLINNHFTFVAFVFVSDGSRRSDGDIEIEGLVVNRLIDRFSDIWIDRWVIRCIDRLDSIER